MKIIAIGDPHGDLGKIKKIPIKGVDLILLTGDLGSANLMRKMAFENIERKKHGLSEIKYPPQQRKKAFMEAYNSTIRIIKYLVKFAPVYIIYGNVESSNAETKKESKQIKLKLPFLTDDLSSMKNVKIINNKLIKFNKIKIGGLKYFVDTCWVKEFKPSDYSKKMKKAGKETKKVEKILKKFDYVDILLCHQPPYGILDKVNFPGAPKNWKNKHAGSQVILGYIKDKKPKYVFCGHIHEGEGMKKLGKTKIYNLGICGYKILKF